MARLGEFDVTGLPAGWFDETSTAAGWFDDSLVEASGSGGAAALEASVTSVCAVAGAALTTGISLGAAVTCVSSAITADLKIPKALAAAIAAISSQLSADLTTQLRLNATVTCQATITGAALATEIKAATSIAATSAVISAGLSTGIQLAASVGGVSTTTATLASAVSWQVSWAQIDIPEDLRGTTSCASQATATTLSTAIRLAATVASNSAVTLAFYDPAMVATIASVSSATAKLTVGIEGLASGDSTASGTLTTDIRLAADVRVAEADPLYSKNTLLLHFDGAQGSTTAVDSSSHGYTVTAVGDAHISAGQSVYGGTSAEFSGVLGDAFVTSVDPINLAATLEIEARIWIPSGVTWFPIVTFSPADTRTETLSLGVLNGLLTYRYNGAKISGGIAPVSTNTWVSVGLALTSATAFALSKDGTNVGTGSGSALSGTVTEIEIGRNTALGLSAKGYLDDLRITTGAYRHAGSYDATLPHPDSAVSGAVGRGTLTDLSANIAGVSAVTGGLTTAIQLAASAASVSASTGTLAVTAAAAFEASVTNVCSVLGADLSTGVRLASSISVASAISSAGLTTGIQLHGLIQYAMGLVSDNFNRANGGLGGNWQTLVGSPITYSAPTIVSNAVTVGGGGGNGAKWVGAEFSNDQYAQAKSSGVGTNYTALVLRHDGVNTGYIFRHYHNNGTWNITNVGSTAVLASGDYGSFVSGDIFRFECVANQLSAFRNGAPIVTGVPIGPQYTAGAPGLLILSGGFVDDWEGGGLGSPGVTAVAGLSTGIQLAASVASVTTATGDLSTGIALASSVASVCSVVGADLTTGSATALAASVGSVSSVTSATLTTGVALASSIAAVCAANGTLTTGIALAASIVATGGDPYLANVSLLLHLDGTDGSTTITDSSPTPKTATAFVSAKISTTQSAFGGSSGFITAASNYSRIEVPDHADFAFGSGDFTVEFWVYLTSVTASQILVQKATSTGYYPWQIWLNSSAQVAFRGFDTAPALYFNLAGPGISANTLTFVQARREGSVFSIAINGGTPTTVTAGTNALYAGADHVVVGNYDSLVAAPLLGYIDDLRITKGVARALALPTAAFPDASGGGVTTVGALTTGVALASSIAAVSTVTGASLTTAIQLAATAAAVSTITAADLAGNAAQLAASVATQTSIVSASLTTAVQLAASIAAVSSVANADLTVGAATLVASSSAVSTIISASLTTAVKLAAAVSATTATNADMSAQIRLASSVAAVSTAIGATLTTGVALAAAPAAVSTATGALTTAIRLAGAAASVATATGDLAVTSLLTANLAACVVTTTAALSTGISLAGGAFAVASLTGNLDTGIRLAGAATSVVSVTAGLAANLADLSASITAQSAVTGALITEIRLAGGAFAVATLSGDLYTEIVLAGTGLAASSVTAALGNWLKVTGPARDVTYVLAGPAAMSVPADVKMNVLAEADMRVPQDNLTSFAPVQYAVIVPLDEAKATS